MCQSFLAKCTNLVYTAFEVIALGVGIKLKEILRDKGITIKQLSIDSGISLNTLYSITKRDSERVDPVILNSIAKALDVPVSALLSEAEKISAAIDIAMRATYPDLTGKTSAFQGFSEADKEILKLGGFGALSVFYNLPQDAQKKALEDIPSFIRFVAAKYKAQTPPTTEDK